MRRQCALSPTSTGLPSSPPAPKMHRPNPNPNPRPPSPTRSDNREEHGRRGREPRIFNLCPFVCQAHQQRRSEEGPREPRVAPQAHFDRAGGAARAQELDECAADEVDGGGGERDDVGLVGCPGWGLGMGLRWFQVTIFRVLWLVK